MTAAPKLAPEDVAAIARATADELERRGLVRKRPANEAPEAMTPERRESVRRKVRANLRRRGVGSGP